MNAASRGTQIKCELHICGKGCKRGGGFVPLETHCKLPYIPSKSVHIVSATSMDTRGHWDASQNLCIFTEFNALCSV